VPLQRIVVEVLKVLVSGKFTSPALLCVTRSIPEDNVTTLSSVNVK